jgi:putative PIN family toxin of toxin-antitoxin system
VLRIVLDTNVIISAIIRNGEPRKLLEFGINGKYRILMSREILNEFSEVLQRPKFKTTVDEVTNIISALVKSSENVTIKSNLKVIASDPDDDIMINTAYDGKADYIVSGDSDIKSLRNFKGVKIVSVDEMLKILDRV